MANINAPFGLRQIGLNGSSVSNFANGFRKGGIAQGNTTPIYSGDPIMRLATGYLAQWVNGTGVSQLVGTFFGCEYYSVSQNTKVFNKFWPGTDASGDVDVWYVPIQQTAPSLFQVQSGAAGIAFADIGANVDIVVGTGSLLTGFSGAFLSTIATTATLPFTVIDIWSRV